MLQEYGLEFCEDSAVSTLDSDLEIEQPTFLIPYSEKFEFPKKKLVFGELKISFKYLSSITMYLML